jgi:hypothetical protein
VADKFELAPQDVSRPHRQIWRGTLQRLLAVISLIDTVRRSWFGIAVAAF